MNNYLGTHHPFFIPLWRRVATVVLCLGWAIFEFAFTGSPFWGILFGALGVYCLYSFFVVFDAEAIRAADAAAEAARKEKP